MMRGFNACSVNHGYFSQNLDVYKETKDEFQLDTYISTILSRILVGGIGVIASVHGCPFNNLVHQFKFRVTRGE
jgi:hypothetical protein